MCEDHYNWILTDVAVGDIQAGTDLDHLQAQNITAIVCVVPRLPHPVSTYRSRGFSLVHIPIDDAPSVNIQRWFDDVSDFIMAQRLLHHKVLVHCHAGMSRSVSLVCAFLMNLLGCDSRQALAWIRQQRPCINVNPGFKRQLEQYGNRLRLGQQPQIQQA